MSIMKKSLQRDYGSLLALADAALDGYFRHWPRKPLTQDEMRLCRVVAHRGCWSTGSSVFENTLPAFEAALECGAWGIEFDIQWTLDNVPVVIHDTHTARIPDGVAMEIGQVRFDELRSLCPQVPSAQEVALRFGGRLHLMVELKAETINAAGVRNLAAVLGGLDPLADFHLMALDAEILQYASMFPPLCRLLVATVDTKRMLRQAMEHDVGGLTGHYFLLNSRMRRQLSAKGLKWGTGFVNSLNLAAREVRAGSQWLFTEAAEHLAGQINGEP